MKKKEEESEKVCACVYVYVCLCESECVCVRAVVVCSRFYTALEMDEQNGKNFIRFGISSSKIFSLKQKKTFLASILKDVYCRLGNCDNFYFTIEFKIERESEKLEYSRVTECLIGIY